MTAAAVMGPECREGCTHQRACRVADLNRAAAGHGVSILPRPKMDARSLVAAVCDCGQYSSGPSTVHQALRAWRQHADDTLRATVDGIRPHLYS